MGATTPTVWLSRERDSATGWRGELEREAAPFVTLRVDSETWFGWLEEEGTTSFRYPLSDARAGYIAGFMTVRKERRARGGQLLGSVSSVSGAAAEGLSGGKPAPDPGASGTASAEVSCRKSRTRATRREKDGVSKKERRW